MIKQATKNHLDKKRIIAIFIMFVILISIIINVFVIKSSYIDNIFLFSNDNTFLFEAITKLGDWYTLILLTLLTLVIKNKMYFKYVSINLVSITILNQMLKHLIRRTRPLDGVIKASGYSFPSGHAMVSMAYYGFIIYLIIKSNFKFKYKVLFITLISVIIFSIGFSRIYLGVHYFTDVIAGFCFSIIYLLLYTFILERKDII